MTYKSINNRSTKLLLASHFLDSNLPEISGNLQNFKNHSFTIKFANEILSQIVKRLPGPFVGSLHPFVNQSTTYLLKHWIAF
jgi:hypothetical protein